MLPVVISTANFGYLDFVTNLLTNVKEVLKNHRFVMYCMDRELFNAVKPYSSEQIKVVLYDCNVPKHFAEYGSNGAFSAITHIKTELIRSAVQKYGFVHFVDGDVVFCKEPTEEYYAAYAEYDIVYQRDLPPSHPPYVGWACTGNFVLRNTLSTLQFLDRLLSYQKRLGMNDQECQREMFRDAKITDIRDYPGIRLTEFPMEHFAAGFVVRDSLFDFSSIMVFHANWAVGKSNKIELLKKIDKWYQK